MAVLALDPPIQQPEDAAPRGSAQRPVTTASERGLDATAFCLADVADGLGPFLVIYLTSQQLGL